MRHIALGCFSLLLVAATANAEWLEASGDHFVIYSDQSEKVVLRFAERLERFQGAMATVFAKPQITPGPSNRVTIYVVSSGAEVRKVTGMKGRSVGIYIPRAGGSIALIPPLKGKRTAELTGETILYHEYAHHFMYTLTDRAYPRWFTEGFAEFFANVQFRDDGSIILGMAANYRAWELMDSVHVPIRELLSFDGGPRVSKGVDTSFYGQSWVLFHYLLMTPDRPGQWGKYHRLLADGSDALEAAEGAFGDLAKLEKDMDSYVKRRSLMAKVVPAAALTIAPISVRKLRKGEAEMLPIVIESKVGVGRDEAVALVPEARKVVALYPNDAAVLSALAEAEFNAGNDDAAILAADAAIAIDPKQINAHIQKGYALAHKAESGALPPESWKDVRAQFIKANALENDHPVPLVQFYLTYTKQGEQPTKNAIAGLERAMGLAPFDSSLRWLVAQQMVSDERYQEAAQTLGPLAYSPHQSKRTDAARELLKDVEEKLAGGEQAAR